MEEEKDEIGDAAILAIANSKKISPENKKRFFEKEIRVGKNEVYRGMGQLKKAIQSNESPELMAKKTREANRKLNRGRGRIVFAKRQLFKISSAGKKMKNKKYWR